MKKHQIPIAPSLLSSYGSEFAHFSVTIKPGAPGGACQNVHRGTPNQEKADSVAY